MTRQQPPEDLSALAAVKYLFWTEWDPIGCGVPADEYDAYAIHAFGMLKQGEGVEAVAAYLKHIEDDWITLGTTAETRLAVATKAAELVAPSRSG